MVMLFTVRGLEKLQRLQNRGLKICKGFERRYNTVRLHNVTKLPMLKDRRESHLNNFMYGRLEKAASRDLRGVLDHTLLLSSW